MSDFRQPASQDLFFAGRPGDVRLGQWITPVEDIPSSTPRMPTIVIAGCPDDAGVLRNRGRAGAKAGPDGIRKFLYKMAMPMDFAWEEHIRVCDVGNIVVAEDINETHRRAFELAQWVAVSGATLVVLGGGHDFAAPNFSGHAAGAPATKTGLINVDPHLDVRPLEDGQPHSGTPFRQLIEAGVLRGKNFVEFGAQSHRNSREHYAYCREKNVTVVPFSEKTTAEEYRRHLTALAKRCARVGATFDMDACCEAEGTSAAPVVGFTARELCRMAESAGEQLKVNFFEIAEVAPPLDPHERSSRIGAEMVYRFLLGRARAVGRSLRVGK